MAGPARDLRAIPGGALWNLCACAARRGTLNIAEERLAREILFFRTALDHTQCKLSWPYMFARCNFGSFFFEHENTVLRQ